jgi:ELWxxDGT repeat protein
LKNINLNESSNPSRFEKIGNKIFFKTSNNELWQSDGTEAGTFFLMNIAKPSNETYPIIKDSFFQKSDGVLYFGNYSVDKGYELWKSDGTIAGIQIIKNIVTYKTNSTYYDTKVKLGPVWFFNGADSHGAELWKSDGTAEGTTMIKDLNPGFENTLILEITNTNNLVFFIGIQNGEARLFRSDGTAEGTFQLPAAVMWPDITTNVKILATTPQKIYFKTANNDIWVSDGSILGTIKIETSTFFGSTPMKLIGIGDKCIVANERLYLVNGIPYNTAAIFGTGNNNIPMYPENFVNLNGSVYYLGNILLPNSTGYTKGLFQTDGTLEGSSVVKYFPDDEYFTSSNFTFLQKTKNKLYFKANLHPIGSAPYFDLWTSDGTAPGTFFLEKINTKSSPQYSYNSFDDIFYLSQSSMIIPTSSEVWQSNGTTGGTFKLLDYTNSSLMSGGVKFKNKFYYSIFKSEIGTELWETDGTIWPTKLSNCQSHEF